LTTRTQSKTQAWILLGHKIAGQVQQAGEVWKAIALELCDALPPGDDVDAEDIKESIQCVQQGAEESGEPLTFTRLRHVLLVGRRNYDWLTSDISFTALEECGDNPNRFSWYQEYGSKLSKRQVRRLRGDRKGDSPNEAMEEYVRLMDEGDEDAILDFLIKHPKIRAMHDRLTNKAYALDEDGREAGRSGGSSRDPEWSSGERLAAELERAHRNIRLRLQCVAENLGPSTPKGRIVTATNELIALLSMAEPMMTGVTSIEQYLSQFPNE
jgi:hypothetical protein